MIRYRAILPSHTVAISISICLVLLAACSGYISIPTPSNASASLLSCSVLTKPVPYEVVFKEDSPTVLIDKIRNMPELDSTAIQVSPQDREGDVVVDWNADSGRYYALFREEKLTKIDIDWHGMKPTIGHILRCLGPPDFYHAIYRQDRQRNIQVALWYVEKGAVFDGYAVYTQPESPKITSEFELGRMTVAKPSRIDEMVSDVYSVSYAPAVYAYALRILKPWPGSIDAIEVDSCVKDPDLCRMDNP